MFLFKVFGNLKNVLAFFCDWYFKSTMILNGPQVKKGVLMLVKVQVPLSISTVTTPKTTSKITSASKI